MRVSVKRSRAEKGYQCRNAIQNCCKTGYKSCKLLYSDQVCDWYILDTRKLIPADSKQRHSL